MNQESFQPTKKPGRKLVFGVLIAALFLVFFVGSQIVAHRSWCDRVKARLPSFAKDSDFLACYEYPHLFAHAIGNRDKLLEPAQIRSLFVEYAQFSSTTKQDTTLNVEYVVDTYVYSVGWWGKLAPLTVVVTYTREKSGVISSIVIDAHSVFVDYLQELYITRGSYNSTDSDPEGLRGAGGEEKKKE